MNNFEREKITKAAAAAFVREKSTKAAVPKNENGKYVIDCNNFSYEKVPLTNSELMICISCGKHKNVHSLISSCKFLQKEDYKQTRKIIVPEWIDLNDIEFLNKKTDDSICKLSLN